MNNYEGNKKGNRNNNNFKKKNGNGNSANNNKAERDAKRAEIIAKQTKNLGMIEAVAEFLDDQLKNDSATADSVNSKISMQKIIDYLSTSKGFAQEDTKAISQFNYLIMDLANAQKSTYVKGNRINIRILYIQERLKTSFKKELYDNIDNLINKYNTLFYWNPMDENPEESGIEIVVNDERASGEATATEV